MKNIYGIMLVAVVAGSAYGATWELMPLVGYQVNTSKDLAGPRNDRLDFKSRPLIGLSLGYLTQDDGQIELAWTHANSAAEVQRAGGAPADRFDVGIDQVHFNFMYMTQPEPVQPFVLIGLGATHFTPAGSGSSNTFFSFAVGGGVKWLWTDHIGMRFDARWTPAVVTRGSHFFCGEDGTSACYSTETNTYFGKIYPFLNSFEFTSGLLFRY
jgi:opacity protein-like surface antigen